MRETFVHNWEEAEIQQHTVVILRLRGSAALTADVILLREKLRVFLKIIITQHNSSLQSQKKVKKTPPSKLNLPELI